MPMYEYECQKCRHDFTLTMSIQEQDKAKIQCPKCDSQDLTQVIEPVFVRTGRKS